MMRRLTLLCIFALLILLTSCDIFLSEPKPTIRMITVASDYTNQIGFSNTLPSCPIDQEAIKSQLEYLSSECGYEFEGVHITYEDGTLSSIVSSSLTGETTFRESEHLPYETGTEQHMRPLVIEAFEFVAKRAQENDITIFYYSGHGARGNEYNWVENGTLYFERDSKDCLHPHEIYSLLSEIKGKKLLLIDACYSGAFVYDDVLYPETTKDAFDSLFVLPNIKNDDTWMISAARSDEISWAPPKKEYACSYFTAEVLKCLGFDTKNFKTGLPSDRDIYFSDILAYSKEHVTSNQHPQGETTIRDLLLFSLPNL